MNEYPLVDFSLNLRLDARNCSAISGCFQCGDFCPNTVDIGLEIHIYGRKFIPEAAAQGLVCQGNAKRRFRKLRVLLASYRWKLSAKTDGSPTSSRRQFTKAEHPMTALYCSGQRSAKSLTFDRESVTTDPRSQ
jgi:hypothetical protein